MSNERKLSHANKPRATVGPDQQTDNCWRRISSDFPAPYQHVSQARHCITWQRFTWSLVLCAGYSRLPWGTKPTAGLLNIYL